jgi:hypothetical protein
MSFGWDIKEGLIVTIVGKRHKMIDGSSREE